MLLRALALAAPVILISACSNAVDIDPVAPASATASASPWTIYSGAVTASPTGSWSPDTVAAGTFLPFRTGAAAITYDPAVVPPGANAEVAVTQRGDGTDVRLTAAGLVPRRVYGAHLHTAPCTAAPDAAGPHYQHRKDPSSPSVDPSYANPRNEVWLDLTADASGAATVTSRQPWAFPPGRWARSLVLHAQPTATAPGKAGTAGPRVACLTLPQR